MTTREQIRHLTRRFGFGASVSDIKRYEKLGVDATIHHLIDFESVDERFPISPWEICFEPDKTEMYFDPPRIGMWWALRMLLTERPLQENLTLFWHNHFAVSAQKVEFGPMMLHYLELLRTGGSRSFPEVLGAASTSPAMVQWLDTNTSFKGHPNENFARELMELFTLGIGNYTEQDVKEAARAFAGWGLRYLVFEPGGEKIQQTARDHVRSGLPMVAFCLTPELMDSGPKQILGKSGNLDGFAVLGLVAERPETARRISRKMWSWYAYEEPELSIVEHLSGVFSKSGGNTRAMLREIVAMPEFWSTKSVRQKVKSPADFFVGIMRNFEVSDILRVARPANSGPETPLPKPLRDVAGLLWGSMYQEGLALLYPPDVGGWHWGSSWISTANITHRIQFANLIFGVSQPDKVMATYLGQRLIREYSPTSSVAVADALCEVFDVEFGPEKRAVLVKSIEGNGGPSALATPASASMLLSRACNLIFGAPEFQMC